MTIQKNLKPSSISGNPKIRTDAALFKRHKHISCSIIIIFFILMGFAIYANTINAPFIYDDIRNITENEHIRMTELSIDQIAETLKSPAPRPAANLSFALNYYFDQYNPAGYHIVNIVIHIITGILLFLFLKITLNIAGQLSDVENKISFFGRQYSSNPNILPAFLAALIWLVHPLNTQSVTFIVQRMNSMSAMFYMLSFLCYIKGRTLQQPFAGLSDTSQTSMIKPGLWFAGCLVSGILALASKQNAAMLPFFIILFEWFFFQDLKWDWVKKKLLWIGCMIFIMAAIAAIFFMTGTKSFSLYAIQNFTLPQRLLTEFRVLLYYISLIFYPHPSRLNLDYDYPISISLTDPMTTTVCFIVIAVLLAVSVIFAKKNRLLSFAILWFFGNLAVESTFIGLALIFEHRTYLPSMMLIFLFVMLLFKSIKIKWISLGIVFILIPLLSIWTFQRNMIWQDDITFWQDNIRKSPNKANPYNNLGYTLMSDDSYDRAITYLKTAISLNPHYAEAHHNLGAAYNAVKDHQKAIYHLQQALKEEPFSIKTYYSLGRIYHETGDQQNALNTFKKIIAIDPNNAEALNDIGMVLKSQNKPHKALGYFKKAIESDRKFIPAYINCGALLADLGKTDTARTYYSDALAIDPKNVEIHNNLGNLAAKKGQYKKAIDYYTRALGINQDHVITLKNMGNTFLAAKQYKKAADYYQKVLNITPDDAQTHNNLATAFVLMKKFDQAIIEYKTAVSLDPEFTNAMYQLAVIYAFQKKYDNAIKTFKQILELDPDNSAVCYNIACMYSRQNNVEHAVKWLKKTVGMGYDNWEMIKTDQDLENIRETAYYRHLLGNEKKKK